MNIIEAVQLAENGKKIRRQCWGTEEYIYFPNPAYIIMRDEDYDEYLITINDILADDWKEVGLLSFDELEQDKIYRVESHMEHEIYTGDLVRLALQNHFGAYNILREHFALITIQSDRKIEADGYYLDYAKKLKYREVILIDKTN